MTSRRKGSRNVLDIAYPSGKSSFSRRPRVHIYTYTCVLCVCLCERERVRLHEKFLLFSLRRWCAGKDQYCRKKIDHVPYGALFTNRARSFIINILSRGSFLFFANVMTISTIMKMSGNEARVARRENRQMKKEVSFSLPPLSPYRVCKALIYVDHMGQLIQMHFSFRV